jgi:hypothetical protein
MIVHQESLATSPDARTQAEQHNLRQETEFVNQSITFSTGAWGKLFGDQASGSEGRASDFNVLRGDAIDFHRIRRMLDLAKQNIQQDVYFPPIVFVLPINNKMEQVLTIVEISSLKESSAARSWGETPKQGRPFCQLRAYIPHNFNSVGGALRHGNAVYSGILRRRPTTRWVFPGLRQPGERESYYQDIKQGVDYQSTQTVNLPLIGEKKGNFHTNILEKPEYLTDQGLLLMAKIISLVRQGKNVDLIAEKPNGKPMGRYDRILFAQQIAYLLSTDKNFPLLSWCTDPISNTNTQLVFRQRDESIPRVQFYGGRGPITLDPLRLALPTPSEAKLANFLAGYRTVSFEIMHKRVMRGEGKKIIENLR